MRKTSAFVLALVCVLGLAGCSDTGMTLDIGETSKIELRSGNDGTTVEITNTEDMQYITSNINALTFIKGESSKDYSGWSYSLKWYDSKNNLMEEIVVMSEHQIKYKDYFYKVAETAHTIDISFFDALLDKKG